MIMAFNPENITREHILAAVKEIEDKNIDLIPSTLYLVEINGKNYPPKEIMRYAHKQMNGEKLWLYSGGNPTNKFFEQMGFKINTKNIDPVKDLIDKYKTHLRQNGLKGEDYKWKLLAQFKGRPNTDAEDFSKEIRGINFSNLIYHNGIAVAHHLLRIDSELYREYFKELFDETKDLQERVTNFNKKTLTMYRREEKRLSHHQDERTIATFLTFHNPDKYTFFKDSFYRKYCELIGTKPKARGEKYIHYLELVDTLISEYITTDNELISLVNKSLPADAFPDSNHRVLAQDILFQTLDRRMGTERNYWRIGTTGGEKSYWDLMKDKNVVCIGWSKLGDLDNTDINSRKDIEKLFENGGYYKEDNRTKSRKAGEVFNFYNDIKINDIVLAQDGYLVHGIGIVRDEYHFEESDPFPHQRIVEWKIFDPDINNRQGNQTTVFNLTDIGLINQIDELLNSKIPGIKKMKQPLNQILFGPPGTGKTYQTINKALDILGENIDGKSRKEIKDLFDSRISEGQIVFTTFHQSMSYEDFIEGIKPLAPKQEGTQISYKIVDGIFKKACAIAGYKSYKLFIKSKSQRTKYSFDDLYQAFISSIQEQIDQHTPTVYKTIRGRDVEIKEININESIIARAKNSISSSSAPLTKENLQKLYDKFKSIDEIEDLQQVKETVQVTPRITEFYAVFSGLKEFEKTFQPDELLLDETKETEDLDYNEIQKKYNAGVYNDAIKVYGKEAEPIILIIDEINRGNVSQIFGELITLVEEDKRLGKEEALEVILPYSKEKFGVPPNLYIIGTMNTADRSVEALDTALRRRFSFEEKFPLYDLMELQYEYAGYSANKILLTINNRIEKLLDKDHTIGHSYFIGNQDMDNELKLLDAFYTRIIPLLQEYFYGDYGKIGLVLGSGFVYRKSWKNESNSFANFDYESAAEFDEKDVYAIVDYRIHPEVELEMTGREKRKMNFSLAIKSLMNEALLES